MHHPFQVVDIPFGRVIRIDPRDDPELALHYDGWPNISESAAPVAST